MDSNYISLSCANCGKGEESITTLKKCGACMMVKYCSSACQKAHRPQHKKECKQRAAELHEEALFKQPPPPDDCPICMLPLPFDTTQLSFESCCGVAICNACMYSMAIDTPVDLCAFCREPVAITDEEDKIRIQKLIDKGNAFAISNVGSYYFHGQFGYPIDYEKAVELFRKAAELGYAEGYYNLAVCYDKGRAVAKNKKTARHYYELAAMNGHVQSRHNLGILEGRAGNVHQAYRHFLIAAKAGSKISLDAVRQGFKDDFVTKDEYATTLRAYQKINDEVKSIERDKAREIMGSKLKNCQG